MLIEEYAIGWVFIVFWYIDSEITAMFYFNPLEYKDTSRCIHPKSCSIKLFSKQNLNQVL